MSFEEEWAIIPEFPNYEVSNFGQVRNWRGHIKYLKHDSYGYPAVDLYIDGKRTMKLVHKLVARAFIPNPDNKPTINHIDGNKCNNRVDNLEWCTHSENMKHAVRTGLNKPWLNFHGIRPIHPGRKPKRVRIIELDMVFDNASDCAYYLNRNTSKVYACISGEHETCAGYHLEYVKE